MKKILAILMAICMLIPLFGINAFAQEEDHDLPIDYQFKKVEEKSKKPFRLLLISPTLSLPYHLP